ncbi:MarR family transcriptional regulator [Vibrio sp. 10N.286.49.C2]|uniref:MarR family winged helix-turn-helix transcriptional regulator n=1 Tax=unclassified Vibrio TaxID=2614977 RepID=UPI000C839550|nr:MULTISPECIES: MarR family transcriptional regulator [unclassified Vibrio]PMH29570.1 MarR family transcriptional regulator [Vibrio sp. 10N.286.49.C2]PMH56085.1 MarR family transcriptional regulator [Vibrio sp. 10N.286.49.B1]PMH77654.1 MarR family transcriptional regulator [Vibrio sp. 10N.286.48.B7]
MSIESSIEDLERLTARVWRANSQEDPLSHLSFNEYDYLKAIQTSEEPIRLTDLANELDVSKPSATNMVKRLERKGLVERIACLDDARSKRVRLTEKARVPLSSEVYIYGIVANKLKAKLNTAESELLDQLLAKALS